MGEISVYIKTIAFFMIFSAFVEIIAPSGGFKKYIRLILSLVLIALILEPLAAVLGGGGFERARFKDAFTGGLLNAETSERERRLYEARGIALSVSEYKRALNETTEQVILTETGFKTLKADVVVNENPDDESFLGILGVHVSVLAANGASNTEENENENSYGNASIVENENENSYGNASIVERMFLGGISDYDDRERLKQAASEKIKNSLSHFYNIETDNIHITVQDE